MAHSAKKSLGKTKYKYVYKTRNSCGNIKFDGRVLGRQKQGFSTEKEAAIWVDKTLINEGKEPVNILKRK